MHFLFVILRPSLRYIHLYMYYKKKINNDKLITFFSRVRVGTRLVLDN